MHTKLYIKFFTGLLFLFISIFCQGQGLNITSGASVVVNNNGSIVINSGSFNNDGTFIPGTGNVLFTGISPVTIGGKSLVSFYNFGINRTSGIQLLKNINVANNVLLVNNNINLNGFNLDLGTTGSLMGEGANSYISSSSSGYVIRTINLNAPTAVNAGNIGAEITSTSNLGSTVIKRGHQQQQTLAGPGIRRYFDFVPTNNTALNATVKLYYLDAEISGFTKSALKQWSSPDNGVTWVLIGSDAIDTNQNFVVKNNINVLNRLTLSIDIAQAVYKLLSFTCQFYGNDILLKWSTMNHSNVDHFDLQKSDDGINFTTLTKVAAINQNAIQPYTYTDNESFGGKRYYRLKTVNKDGSFVNSSFISIIKTDYPNALIKTYPNPTSGPISVEFSSSGSIDGSLQISSSDGKIILNKVISIAKGLNKIDYDLGHLSQGTYFVKIVGLDTKVLPIIKY